MKKLTYENGDKMPAFGLGTWKSAPGDVYKAVKFAIEAGYRHIDCAPIYGNEKEVGQAISESIKEGFVRREDLWITSKLWNSEHIKEDVLPAIKQSLEDLQIDYLDLYLIHWPVALKKGVDFPLTVEDTLPLSQVPIIDTWRAMEEAVELSLIKHIGVSNFGVNRLKSLLSEAKIKPEVNQVESHPYFQQNELLAYCTTNNIFLTAYAPLGSNDRPAFLKNPNQKRVLEDEVISKIANKKGITPAQVLIAWALNRGVSVIPKSTNPERIVQNLNAKDIELSNEDLNSIAKLEKSERYLNADKWVFDERYYTTEKIWA